MSSITLVVPRAEKESVFLQLVVQAAIHAYREDAGRIHEAKIDTVNGDRSGAFSVAA